MKGISANTRKPLQLAGVDAELARGDDQRAFGRVALHHPAALALHQRRVVGERCGPQQFRDGVAVRRAFVDLLAFDREVALGDVAAAADVDQRVGGGDGAQRHLVAGQRAGLVRADHGRGAERLDRRQLADDGVGRRHPPHAEAQPHGDDRRQRLGDRGDGERHREQEQAEHDVERERGGAEQAGREHHGADSEHDDAQPLAGAVELLLQRRRLLLGRLQQAGDAADFGRHAGGDHHGAAAAIGGDRAGEQHVAAVAEPDVALDRLELLGHRHALAGQRRLVGLQVRHLDEAGVRRNLVAGLDQHDVAGDDVMGRDALAIAVANDRGFRRGERHQGADRFLRARLLDEAEHGVEHDDRHDDDRLVGQGALARVLQHPFDHRDHDGDQQDDHQEIFELLQQPFPPRRFRRALQPVGAVLLRGAAAPRTRLRPRATLEPSAATTASAGLACGADASMAEVGGAIELGRDRSRIRLQVHGATPSVVPVRHRSVGAARGARSGIQCVGLLVVRLVPFLCLRAAARRGTAGHPHGCVEALATMRISWSGSIVAAAQSRSA